MFISNYTNKQYETKCVFSRHLKLVRLSQVLMTVGKLFHRDAAATANEPSPALVRVSVSVYVTGKMSWGHITPVRMVGRLD